MLSLGDALRNLDLDPATIIVMRHRPTEQALRDALPYLAAERPDVYNAYQCVQGEKAEKSLSQATHLVSTIGTEAGVALFAGLYAVSGFNEMLSKTWRGLTTSQELLALGDRGPSRETILHFDLQLLPQLADMRGRLLLGWPPPERSWWRRAHRNVFPVEAVYRQSAFVEQMPDWRDLVLPHHRLQSLPTTWQATLSQWRGIYVIVDQSSGQQYVGSAYGSENILARWRQYASSGHGGNVGLRGREAVEFHFAILERVSPDMPAEEVIRLEATWKKRLGTREFGLNAN